MIQIDIQFFGGRGTSSSRGSNPLQAMIDSADSPNKVLNHVPDTNLGKTFQGLSPYDKSVIRSVLKITKHDAEFLQEYTERGNQSQALRINGIKYTAIIEATKSGDVLYSLKRGNKNIVSKGTYENVANQLAMLIKKKN